MIKNSEKEIHWFARLRWGLHNMGMTNHAYSVYLFVISARFLVMSIKCELVVLNEIHQKASGVVLCITIEF